VSELEYTSVFQLKRSLFRGEPRENPRTDKLKAEWGRLQLWEVRAFTLTWARPISVHELSKINLDSAAHVYAQGLLAEVPPGVKAPLEEVERGMRRHLQRLLWRKSTRRVWLARMEGTPCGILDFFHRKRSLRIRFLCAVPQDEGIGTQLLSHLARFAENLRARVIRCTVSTLDERALHFYFRHLGFQQVGIQHEEPGFDLALAAIQTSELLQRCAAFGG
jgi:GNAT superfamily N-acetyltransferase